MNRFFCIAGPINTERHYHIEPLSRVDWQEIQMLIAQDEYFVLHAPRQTGKTTTLLAMAKALNECGEYVALYANIEEAQAARNDAEKGIKVVCNAIVNQASDHVATSSLKRLYQNLVKEGEAPVNLLSALLSEWAKSNEKPCVLFLDEVDALVGDTLISLLRQIRAGYARRPKAFPQSIVLCGVRDVRDYRIHSDGEIITGGSAFNIKSESLRLGNFSEQEVKALYQQHSDATGQQFAPEVYSSVWPDTKGQPWLVNALAREMTFRSRRNGESGNLIQLEDYLDVREKLIHSRATHLDQLSDKLNEPRVRRVIAPILSGEHFQQLSPDDVDYVVDLGLLDRAQNGALSIANQIYQEVIFNRDKKTKWEDKIWRRSEEFDGKVVEVWGC